MPLSNILLDFRARISEVNSFIDIAFQQDANGRYLLPSNQRDFIIESAFLKIYVAWETFLEKSFIEYMMGEASIDGKSIIKYANPNNHEHAHKLLIGTQKYVDWSNPDIVRKLCIIFFETNNPFDSYLGAMNTDLFDLRVIRNSAAHLSSTTSSQLDALGSRLLRTPCANLTVSRLIFSADPTSAGGSSLLDTYLLKLDIAAEGIAKA